MIKFLVVDDEIGTCNQIKDFLEMRGYEVYTANDGASALNIAKEQKPHIMILDIRMPQMSGMEVLKELKSVDSKIKVIMLTAVEDDETKKLAKELGAYEYITKPYDFNEILRISRKIINEIYESSK